MLTPSIQVDTSAQCFNPFKEAWEMAAHLDSLALRSSSGNIAPRNGHSVYIHVYDVSQEKSIQKLNKVLAHASSPLKFGGVFHAGVEVNGLEWSFCFQPDSTKYGVECNRPKSHPNHHFRETIKMGPTEYSEQEIATIIADMVEKYPGNDYDLLRRNCCHFADELCQRLGVGCMPSWIYRLADVGAGVAAILEAADSVRHKVIGNLRNIQSEPHHTYPHIPDARLMELKAKCEDLRTKVRQNPQYLLTLREADIEME